MKRLRIYVLLFSVLAILALVLFLSRRTGPGRAPGQDITVTDTGRIEYFRIASSAGEVFLSRHAEGWQVNGKPAKQEALRGLFVLVTRLEAGAPVSSSREESILRGLSEESTSVTIGMESGGEKSYRVYFDLAGNSSYIMPEGSSTAYSANVRGFRQTDLESLFRTDPAFWRDNVFVSLVPSEIITISLLHQAEPESSFHLARDENGDYSIARGIIPREWVPVDTERTEQYLGYFYDVRFESFLDWRSDTLIFMDEPAQILNLATAGGTRYGMELFPVFRPDGSGGLLKDLNRLYARIIQGDEWVVLKYVQIDPVLKDFKYFRAL